MVGEVSVTIVTATPRVTAAAAAAAATTDKHTHN